MKNYQFYRKRCFWILLFIPLLILGGPLFIIKFCPDPAQWVAIFIALLLGFGATFREFIISCFKKPVWKISIKNEPPDCVKAVMRNLQTGKFVGHAYYLRFKVENDGNYHMEDVEAMIKEVEKKNPNGQYELVKDFLPMNLEWSYYRINTMSKIQPKLFKHCGLCHIVRAEDVDLERRGRVKSSNLIILLDVAVETFIGAYILDPGEYKIKVTIAANNLKPETKIFSLKIKEDIKIEKSEWTFEEEKKLVQNVSIEIS